MPVNFIPKNDRRLKVRRVNNEGSSNDQRLSDRRDLNNEKFAKLKSGLNINGINLIPYFNEIPQSAQSIYEKDWQFHCESLLSASVADTQREGDNVLQQPLKRFWKMKFDESALLSGHSSFELKSASSKIFVLAKSEKTKEPVGIMNLGLNKEWSRLSKDNNENRNPALLLELVESNPMLSYFSRSLPQIGKFKPIEPFVKSSIGTTLLSYAIFLSFRLGYFGRVILFPLRANEIDDSSFQSPLIPQSYVNKLLSFYKKFGFIEVDDNIFEIPEKNSLDHVLNLAYFN